MTIRLSVTHTTSYRYPEPVLSSYNEARLEPRSDRRQTVLSWGLDVSPAARVAHHVDYWGTNVHHFDLQVPHRSLDVVAKAVVETGVSRAEPGDITWAELAEPSVRDQFHELLVATPVVAADEGIDEVGRALRASAGSPAEAVREAAAWVHDHLDYEQGFTGVTSTVAEVRAQRRGVCQDFAHLTLAVLRSMGIPAWYVSGYHHPVDEPELGVTVRGESHAWVAAWTGTVWPVDPTNLSPVHERHVRVAAGRDYHDVAPFRGIFAGGGGEQHLEVSVELTRSA